MRLDRRILSVASGVVIPVSVALLVATLLAWVVTRRTVLLLVNESPFTEVAFWNGSLYWRSDDRGADGTSGLRGFLFMDEHRAPLEQGPGPSAGWLGFASASVRVPDQAITSYLRGPVDSRVTIVPLWFILALLAMPPATRLARRVAPWRRPRPASRDAPATGRPGRIDDALTWAALSLLVLSAAGWMATTFWQTYALQWTGPEWTCAIRSEARQGSVEVWSEAAYDGTGPDEYASTGWRMSWEWFPWPRRLRETCPPESHAFPWFSAIDLRSTQPPGRLTLSSGAPPGGGARSVVSGHRWEVPYWFLLGVTAVRPILRFRARLRPGRRHSVLLRLLVLDVGLVGSIADVRRASRQSAGLCPGCGYDLRASPDGCPECGRRGTRRV